MAWTTPKTNWAISDRFNISDYNRIKNNIQWLIDKTMELCKPIEYTDMGNDVVGYEGYRTAAQFNAFEQNLIAVNEAGFTRDFGTAQTFYANGPFIQYTELNRIEAMCVGIRTILDNMEAGVVDRRFAYIFGRYKELKP